MSNIKITGGQVLDNGLPVGLGGTRYVYVRGNGTPSENATELQAAYNLAKTMTPSSGNTITVVVAPGTYTFGATKFPVNAAYVNIISLTGDADVLLDGINVTANNVYLKGLNCGTNSFAVGDNLNTLVCENCVGGDYSFGYSDNYTVSITNSTFTDCVGGNQSFGYVYYGDVSISGSTFDGCVGGDYSFASGYYGYVSISNSTFDGCVGGDYSFGGKGSINSGATFTNCTGGDVSFGSTIGSGATFTNCVGGNSSFGGNGGTASGTFNDCTGTGDSFGGGYGNANGIFIHCKGDNYSFGGGGTASGTFNNCTGGLSSFGGTASGTFNNCTGDDYSFGGNGAILSTARLYYCHLTTGTFETPAAGGKLVLCIDGADAIITT